MKQMIAIATLTLAATSAQPQEADPPSLMEQGARLFMEGLMQEMEPALNDLKGMADDFQPALKDFAERMGPALSDLMAKVDNIANYEAPEVLDNGDILIRRKPDAPPYLAPEPSESIDL